MQLLDYHNDIGEIKITSTQDLVHIKYKINKKTVNISYNFTEKILNSLIKKETVFLKTDNFTFHYIEKNKELHIGENIILSNKEEIDLIYISFKLLLAII